MYSGGLQESSKVRQDTEKGFTMKRPIALADEMMLHAAKDAEEINAQREEILRAFISKFGFDPEHAMQVQSNQNGQRSWQIVHFTDKDIAIVRKTLLVARVGKEPLSFWQKCCVFMANWKWPK